MRWSESFTVNSHDIDAAGNIKIGALMRFMQETAYLNMAGMKPSAEELRKEGRAFLLARITVSVYGDVSHRDVLRVETWSSEKKGVSYERCFSVYRGEEKICEAQSVWMLFDFVKRKILRVSDGDYDYGHDQSLELELPRRLSVPDEDGKNENFILEGCYTASFSDVDENGHMNNTVYADLLSGYVPEIRQKCVNGRGHGCGKKIVSLYINYSNECRLDEEIKIYRAGGDGEWYFRTVRPDGKVNIEAKILTE